MLLHNKVATIDVGYNDLNRRLLTLSYRTDWFLVYASEGVTACRERRDLYERVPCSCRRLPQSDRHIDGSGVQGNEYRTKTSLSQLGQGLNLIDFYLKKSTDVHGILPH